MTNKRNIYSPILITITAAIIFSAVLVSISASTVGGEVSSDCSQDPIFLPGSDCIEEVDYPIKEIAFERFFVAEEKVRTGRNAVSGQVVIRDEEDFQRFFKSKISKETAKKINFNKEMIVGAFAGYNPSGGTRPAIKKIEEGKAEVVVFFKAPPRSSGSSPQVITYNYYLAKIERINKPVRFTVFHYPEVDFETYQYAALEIFSIQEQKLSPFYIVIRNNEEYNDFFKPEIFKSMYENIFHTYIPKNKYKRINFDEEMLIVMHTQGANGRQVKVVSVQNRPEEVVVIDEPDWMKRWPNPGIPFEFLKVKKIDKPVRFAE